MKAVLLAAAVVSTAAPPELPRYQRGDAFVFTDGRVERVRKVDGDYVEWSGVSSRRWRRHRNFVLPILSWTLGEREGRRTFGEGAERLWPLAKGRSVRFRVVTELRQAPTANWRRSVSLWTCRAGAPRAVTVPAGVFDAWPVTCDRYSPATMKLIEQQSWDYAPELGHYVRRTVVDYRKATRSSFELFAAVRGPAATRERLRALARHAKATSGE